ncbi:ABC transporter substrate-binding protein [Tomitella biformata]|uniref:ABC transporter substrate-binding protein n=1 Tax=Tomitella biformata TaxID=630403 RepID=UPI000467772D|nr:ABC transporter substrate-binding protein [Tomitella biformata]
MRRSKFFTRAALGATALIALGGVAACGSSSTGASAGSLTAGTLVDVQSFDPAVNPGQGQRVFLDPVYDSLLRTDSAGAVIPGLATDYTLTPTAMELTLQENRTFSDGAALDGEAVKANIENRKGKAGPAGSALATVTDVTVTSPTEVTINLSAPSPALPITLTDVAGLMVSPASLDDPDLGTTPVGSGPYVLDTASSNNGVSYVYTPNESYPDKTDQQLERIEIRVLTDDAARASALRSGQIDLAQIAKSQIDAVESGGLEVAEFPGNHWMLQFTDLDGTKSPALANEKIRQAIGYAIDGQQIVDANFFGYGTATHQVFDSTSQFHVEGLEGSYDYNPDKARQLVEESGIANPSFTVPAFGPIKQVTESVQGFLREVGIEMSIELVQPGTLDKENRETNFTAIITPIKQVHPEQLYTDRLAPQGPQNPFHVAHPDIDQKHAAALAAADGPERDAAYQDMLAGVNQQALWIDVLTDSSVVGWNKNVQGVEMTVGWVMGPTFRGVSVS